MKATELTPKHKEAIEIAMYELGDSADTYYYLLSAIHLHRSAKQNFANSMTDDKIPTALFKDVIRDIINLFVLFEEMTPEELQALENWSKK